MNSPCTWEGLENGDVYAFEVTAKMSTGSGADAVSNTKETMPLCVRDFAPWVREVGYRSITVEWWNNPNVTEYMVERSLSPEGPWEVRRNLSRSFFTDDQIDFETEYYYRVYPAKYDSIVSELISGVATRFGFEIVGNRDTSDWARGVAVAGSYAYVADYEGGYR